MSHCVAFPSALVRLMAVAAVLLEASAGRAQDIVDVKLTSAGIDRQIPVGRDFYLSGTAKAGTVRVQPVFLRAGSDVILGGRAERCSSIAERIRGIKTDESGAIPELIPGERNAGEVLTAQGQSALPYRAYTPAAWSGGNGKDDQSYKIFIPGSGSFFKPGFSYCMFVYEQHTTTKVDSATIRNAILDFAYKLAVACTDVPDVGKCRLEALKAHERELDRTAEQAKLDAAAKKELKAARNTLLPEAYTAYSSWAAIDGLLRAWSADLGSGGAGPFRVLQLAPPANGGYFAAEAPFAKLLIELLVRSDALQTAIAPEGARSIVPVAVFTRDGKLEVRWLRLTENDTKVSVAEWLNRDSQRVTLAPKLSSLGFPDSTLTILDVLELVRGRVWFDGGYRPIVDIRARLASLMQPGRMPEDAEAAGLVALGDRLAQAARLFDRALEATAAGAADTPVSGAEEAVLRRLGRWLRTSVLESCQAGFGSRSAVPCAEKGRRWPGYPDGGDPLSTLSARVNMWVRARDRFVSQASAVAIKVVDTHSAMIAVPFEARVEFTQQTWVFSYVTPVVGYAWTLNARDDFALFYLGVQVHAFPNPAAVPLYSQGFIDDFLRRGWALELGFAPELGSFGPDDRFQGWKGLPPLFYGIALHPLPYVSTSVGGVLLERRASTNPQERTELWSGVYFGLNVQLNIPDAIRSAARPNSVAVVSK